MKQTPIHSPAGPEAVSNPGSPTADDESGSNLVITERDFRIVDAYYHELALAASESESPATPAEQYAIDELRARFEALRSMSPAEQAALRTARRRAVARLR